MSSQNLVFKNIFFIDLILYTPSHMTLTSENENMSENLNKNAMQRKNQKAPE